MRRSFQGRIAVLMMLWTGIIFTCFASASWLLIRSQIITTSDQILIGWKLKLQPRLKPWPGLDALLADIPPSPLRLATGTFPVCISDTRGNTLHATTGADWLARFAARDSTPEDEFLAGVEADIRILSGNMETTLFTSSEGGEKVPHRVLRLSTPEVVVLAALNMSEFDAGLLTLKQYFLVGLILGLVLVLLGARLTARRALLPLRRISRAAAAIEDSANLTDRMPATSRDYIEFAALIESLNGMMQRLEKNFLRATRFTADASHELKTPIALLQNAVSTGLRTATPGSVEEAHFLEIADEISRLKKVTEALLLLSAADAGRLNLKLERFDLEEELASLCEDASLLAEQAGITFESHIDKHLAIEADRVLLMQAVQNLVNNATKYNRRGGRIELTCRKEAGQIVIEIENTGPAIPPDQQEAIFDRFHRVARARADEPGGSGLGLNLAREIAKAHRGSLQLVCGEEDAIRFRLTIPAIIQAIISA